MKNSPIYKHKKKEQNHWLAYLSKVSPSFLFLPFLLYFLLLVWLLDDHQIIGDEVRYIKFARNLLNGFYSPPPPAINLWSGPGYPIILLPFVAFKIPYSVVTALNAGFYYLSLLFLFKSLKTILSFKQSLILSVLLGFYYITYNEIGAVLTEHFTMFLCSILLYVLAGKHSQKVKVLVGGFLLGYIALTKVIFGYVILVAIGFTAFLAFLLNRKAMKQYAFLCLLALAVNVPYLTYTYLLTSKPFYWSNAGGMVLYWMSTPYRGEFGDWHDVKFLSDCGEVDYIPCNKEKLSATHQEEIAFIESLPIIERDDAYKRFAIRNIKEHPFKFLRNCVANISRLFFGIPRSYYYQMDISIIHIVPNGILMTFMLGGIFFTARSFRYLKDGMLFLIILIFSYLGLSTLGSAYMRFLYIILPWILYWLASVFEGNMKLIGNGQG